MGKPFKLTPPAEFIPHEMDEQIAVFEWRLWAMKQWPELATMYATLNGVPVSIGLARKMKRAGMTKGACDIVLPSGHGGYFGLYLELKRIKGSRVSADQESMILLLRQANYYAVLAYGAPNAIDIIEAYLKLPKTLR